MAKSVLRSRWVKANCVKTHYTESGDDGPILVALHGGGAGSSGVSGMGPLLRELGENFRVLAPDSIGGYGETDASVPTPRGLLSRVDHTRDFVDSLYLDKFTIIGNSQGAFAAAQYAIDYPERIEKIVCIGSLTIAQAMGVEQAPTAPLKALMAYDGTPGAMRRMLEGIVADHSKITDEVIARRQASATRPGAVESMASFVKITSGLPKHPVHGMRMDMRQSFPRLTKAIPTIFIWGQDDAFALPETGRKVEALLPDVKFHWIPGASHQVQTDKPDVVAKVIREFVLGS